MADKNNGVFIYYIIIIYIYIILFCVSVDAQITLHEYNIKYLFIKHFFCESLKKTPSMKVMWSRDEAKSFWTLDFFKLWINL